jgi:hypothetical protein
MPLTPAYYGFRGFYYRPDRPGGRLAAGRECGLPGPVLVLALQDGTTGPAALFMTAGRLATAGELANVPRSTGGAADGRGGLHNQVRWLPMALGLVAGSGHAPSRTGT